MTVIPGEPSTPEICDRPRIGSLRLLADPCNTVAGDYWLTPTRAVHAELAGSEGVAIIIGRRTTSPDPDGFRYLADSAGRAALLAQEDCERHQSLLYWIAPEGRASVSNTPG